ncbi:MAG: DUF364 domain-containing protein [Candidatus Bathyarchaeia archaeon]
MPGKIVKELLSAVKAEIADIEEINVERVVLGLGYTGVKLNTGNVGLCYTFGSEITPDCCQIWRRAGTLAGSTALEIAELSLSWDLSEAVVGVATLNALSQLALEKSGDKLIIVEDDFINHIDIGKNDTVVLVGNIHPFIPKVKEKTGNIFILERNPRLREPNVLPDTAAEEILPLATIAIITGTALANGTIDRLLELSKNARTVGLVGPTASVYPDPLFKHGVTIVGGVKIVDGEKLLQIISEGGGTPSFKKACRQIVIKARWL